MDAAKGRSAKLLRPSDKRTVARWCVLVATLFDQGQAQPRLDATFHQAFYRDAIPEGVGVWLASVVPPTRDETTYSAAAAGSYLISVSILNIGKYIAMMITPTIIPTTIIMIGSMIEVSVAIDESTSSS